MELEKILGRETIYRYKLNPTEVRAFTENSNTVCWAVLEVYPQRQVVNSYFFQGESEPTLRDIANIREWNDEDYDKVVLWLHQLG